MIDARSPSLGSSESGPLTSPEFVSFEQAQILPRAGGGAASQMLRALGTTGRATPVATTRQQSPGGSNSWCVSATTKKKMLSKAEILDEQANGIVTLATSYAHGEGHHELFMSARSKSSMAKVDSERRKAMFFTAKAKSVMLGGLLKLRDARVNLEEEFRAESKKIIQSFEHIFINKSLHTSFYISCVYYCNHVFITGSLVASLMYLNRNLIIGYGKITQIQEMNVDLIA